jgi:hypothetical protein
MTTSYFGKWKMTSFFQLEDDLNVFENGRRFQNLPNGRRLNYFGKWMTTSIFWKMEYDFKILQIEDDFNIWPMLDNLMEDDMNMLTY